MTLSHRMLILLLVALFALTPALSAQDSTSESPPHIGYYLAADETGIKQVYRFVLGESSARQVTYASGNVITFGVAYSGFSVAYISDGQLWLQRFHVDGAEALASVTQTEALVPPVHSPDGAYIAYEDNGLWLLNLETRETRQLFVDVPMLDDGSNGEEYHVYHPEKFGVNEHGEVDRLIVSMNLWSGQLDGVYHLADGSFQKMDPGKFKTLTTPSQTDLLTLSDGRILAYGGNFGQGGISLLLAQSVDDIRSLSLSLDPASLQDGIWMPLIEVIEISPGVVRLLGTTAEQGENDPFRDDVFFYLDYVIALGRIGETHIAPRIPNLSHIVVKPLSYDGAYLALHQQYNLDGTYNGLLQVMELATGEMIDVPVPEMVLDFQWQPVLWPVSEAE